MSLWLVLVVTVIYAVVAGREFGVNNIQAGIIFSGYALANVGFMMGILKG